MNEKGLGTVRAKADLLILIIAIALLIFGLVVELSAFTAAAPAQSPAPDHDRLVRLEADVSYMRSAIDEIKRDLENETWLKLALAGALALLTADKGLALRDRFSKGGSG